MIEALQGFAEQGPIDFFQVGEVTVDGTRRITRPLGDMDMDGLLDVVVTSNGDVWCWNPVSGNQIGNTFLIPGTGTGVRPDYWLGA